MGFQMTIVNKKKRIRIVMRAVLFNKPDFKFLHIIKVEPSSSFIHFRSLLHNKRMNITRVAWDSGLL